VLIAAAVLLVLLLAPDAFAALGLIFFVLAASLGLAAVSRVLTLATAHRPRPGVAATHV
jgi:hypothetical protein